MQKTIFSSISMLKDTLFIFVENQYNHMQVVILAGGFGTRISEESSQRPKPMIEVGGKPILWHIMKIYSHYGYNDFIICLGYKGHMIKEYFLNFSIHNSDVTVDFRKNNQLTFHQKISDPWKITMVDTGAETMTGGRIKRVADFIDGDKFMMTYGDGVANINIHNLADFHAKHGKLVTVTAAQPMGRYGSLNLSGNQVMSFHEKTVKDSSWINAGYFVMNKQFLEYIKDDLTILEKDPLEKVTSEGNLIAFKHFDFWQPMDTMRDKSNLEELWKNNNAPWKIWP